MNELTDTTYQNTMVYVTYVICRANKNVSAICFRLGEGGVGCGFLDTRFDSSSGALFFWTQFGVSTFPKGNTTLAFAANVDRGWIARR